MVFFKAACGFGKPSGIPPLRGVGEHLFTWEVIHKKKQNQTDDIDSTTGSNKDVLEKLTCVVSNSFAFATSISVKQELL